MVATEPDENRKTYLAERKLLIELECESTRSFDKAMITLSAGALGLSITFVRQLAPMPQCKAQLYVAWVGFILALLCTLASFLFSQSALRKQREILDQDYGGKQSAQEQKNPPATITKWLNWTSIACFIIGVIFLLVFSIKNLPQ
jgi:H+/gluconate symporter-like permease